MTRVSENSASHALNYSMGKAKTKLEDLQIKGSNLKRIQRPSDDPVGNVELMSIRSKNVDNTQYLKNSNFALMHLNYVESSLVDLVEIVGKAKELAIGQSSDFYSGEIRESIAQEIRQLKKQAVAVSNKRLGNRYIFAGQKVLTRPFDQNGQYSGDKNSISIEVAKDFFVPINLNGHKVFFESNTSQLVGEQDLAPRLEKTPDGQGEQLVLPAAEEQNRLPASEGQEETQQKKTEIADNLIADLQSLENALMTNNPTIVHGLLETFDRHADRLIKLQTTLGSLSNSVLTAKNTIEKETILNQEYKSKVEDADVAELFTDLTKQKNILQATYRSGSQLINSSLLDFL